MTAHAPPKVTIRARKPAAKSETIAVSYRIQNVGRSTVYIVCDRCFICVERGVALDSCTSPSAIIRLCLAELPLDSGVDEYGFVIPSLKPLAPGKSMRGRVPLRLPLTNLDVSSTLDSETVEIPLPAEVGLAATVGYFQKAFKPRWADIRMRRTFLRQQLTTQSNCVEMSLQGPH